MPQRDFKECFKTSGIPGGYRLVSTYDLPDFSEMGGGGYFGVNFGHLKSEVFRNAGGGDFGVNFGHLKSEVFRNAGGGGFRSKLWSTQILSFPKWGEGGLSGLKFQKRAFWRIWTKIYCSARNLLVHHR